MQCPQCGARSKVCETRGPFRDRRCTNPACRMDFTTREQIMKAREYGRNCARTRATKIEPPLSPPAANVEMDSNREGEERAAQAQEKQPDRQAEAGG
jgi:hypothetical protein